MRSRCYLRFALGLLVCFQIRSAQAATIFFDDLNDGDSVTTQYPGLTFTNTVVLTAGIFLNEFEFPPVSGTNVASDDGGPITITFDSPVLSFSGYFTYAVPLTLTAFDSGNNQVGITVSFYSSNLALSGDAGSGPNEYLVVNFAGGFSSLTIAGDALGGSFTMDDVTYTSAVPEPNSLYLLLSGAAGMLGLRRFIKT